MHGCDVLLDTICMCKGRGAVLAPVRLEAEVNGGDVRLEVARPRKSRAAVLARVRLRCTATCTLKNPESLD